MPPESTLFRHAALELARYGAAVLLLVGLLFAFFYIATIKRQERPSQVHTVTAEEINSSFSGISIEARAAYVYDLRDERVLYSKNEEAQLPLASITKVMTALTAVSILPPHSIVTISSDDLKQEGDSGFAPGEEWDLNDILNYTLVVSSNDAASAIANAGTAYLKMQGGDRSEVDFLKLMNARAAELGLSQTYFLNASGVDIHQNLSGAYSSAKDVTTLFRVALKEIPEALQYTAAAGIATSNLANVTYTGLNTNAMIDRVPRIIASKTGYTDLAGGNLVIAFDAGLNHPVIVTVLGSSYDGRFKDVETLAWAALQDLALSE